MEHIENINELVQESASGDSESFKVLYEHLVTKVYAYVRYRLNNEDDAIDLTQEVFVDLYKSLTKFTYLSQEQFYGFVFTITKRKLAKYYADTHTQLSKNTSEFDEDQYVEADNSSTVSADIKQALQRLDDIAREIVVLHHWSRYTFPEIATLIHMTESAVRVRHHRALKTLSASLDS
jgi:RNA polymerase sigma-70 factor (ECF subfamily)